MENGFPYGYGIINFSKILKYKGIWNKIEKYSLIYKVIF